MAQVAAFTGALTRPSFSQAAIGAFNNNGLNTSVDLIGLNEQNTSQILKICSAIHSTEMPQYLLLLGESSYATK